MTVAASNCRNGNVWHERRSRNRAAMSAKLKTRVADFHLAPGFPISTLSAQIFRRDAVNELAQRAQQFVHVLFLLHHAGAQCINVAVDSLMILPVAFDRVFHPPHPLLPVVIAVPFGHFGHLAESVPRKELCLMRLENDFDAVVLLFFENGVSFGRIFERHVMSDHKTRVDFAPLDALQQRPHVALHMCLASPESERAVHERTDGELIDEPTIYPYDRDDSSVAARHDRFTQRNGPVRFEHHGLLGAIVCADKTGRVRFHANRVNASVGATSSSQLLEGFQDTDLFIVQSFCSHLFARHAETLWKPIDSNDALCAQQKGALHGKLARSPRPRWYRRVECCTSLHPCNRWGRYRRETEPDRRSTLPAL